MLISPSIGHNSGRASDSERAKHPRSPWRSVRQQLALYHSTACQPQVFHPLEHKLVQTNIQRIAQDWRRASYRMTNIITTTQGVAALRSHLGNAPVAAGCRGAREPGRRTRWTDTG